MSERAPVVGAVFPDDAWVQDDAAALTADFRTYMPPGVSLEAAATPCPNRTNTVGLGVHLAENGDIEEAARRLLVRKSPDVIGYFCTTVSFVRGLGGDEDISRRVTEKTGLPATTTSTAMVAGLRQIGARRVAVASPYMPDVEQKLVEFLTAHGFEVVNSVALNLPLDHSIVAQEDILGAARRADRPEADTVFISCTGQRLAHHLDAIEAQLGKPVLAANQVTAWHALTLIGLGGHWSGPGARLRTGAAPA
ncbi:MAG: hypothetical protein FJ038_00570 [Chloroflexi bacterium]|nr:hypothetical protein [Chloroflexota bacterium]